MTEKHAETWADKSQAYWFLSLVEEVCELGLSLAGLHKDPPEFELAQIASIAINWRKRRLTKQINATAQTRLFTQD